MLGAGTSGEEIEACDFANTVASKTIFGKFLFVKNLDQQDVEALAYLIWKRQGCPESRAEEHWLEAEYQILSKSLIHEKSEERDDHDLRSRGLGSL